MTGGENHLNDRQFAKCLLGEELPAVADLHLKGCATCREEIKQFRWAVGELGVAGMGWSETRRPESLSSALVSKAGRKPRFAVVAWGAAVCAMVAVAMNPRLHHREAAYRPQVVDSVSEDTDAQIAQDNKLMRAVSMELAEGEPSPYREYRLAPVEHRAGRMQTRMQ